jgi:hypothetical protein
MRVAVRKLTVEDVETLQTLVIENFDAIEPGLTVLDTRPLLGHATIDVIGTDTAGALVLGTVGFNANEEMLLKAVEAYSWCLEYPEALNRLYPSCRVSEARPPRLLFVVERMSDAFHRKIKQLGFPEVDCMEFRHLEFDGTRAVYFDPLLRLRRHAVPAAPPTPGPEEAAPATGGGTRNSGQVVALHRTAVREPAPVVSTVSRSAAAPALPRVPRAQPATEPAPVRGPESLVIADPVVAALELDPVVASLSEPVVEPPVAPTAQSGTLAEASGSSVVVDAAPPQLATPHVDTTIAPASESPAAPTVTKPAHPAMPQGFEGLKFPNDGVLTRQWMEFLSQMSATK